MERSAGSMILGRLELIREETASVGVQVFGPTWAVLDHETGELARTCVLDAELLPTEASRVAFAEGLAALSSLRDPTLVPQLFVGVDEIGGAVLYEPLPGGVAFDDLFDGTGSYELTLEAGRLARQLARALAALHARGHVHGMLASPCVFVGPRGPAVYQYGLAPLCDRAVLLRRTRAFGLINLAPELLAGGDFTPSADLYAWAVTVAQFAASSRGPAALEAVRGSDEISGLTPSLRAALQACLSADPAARPRDGTDLLRMIEAAGRGEGSGMLARAEISDAPEAREPAAVIPPAEDSASTDELPTTAELADDERPAAIVEAPAPAVSPPPPPAVAMPAVSPPAISTPAVSPPVATPRAAVPKDRVPTIPPTGMSLPVTSFEEMLMSGDRARRPATIAPGSLNAASIHEETDVVRPTATSAKSAHNLRRVHVLTDPVKRGAGETSGLTLPRTDASGLTPVRSESPGDLLIGGTREEVEAASRATTVRLDSLGIVEAARNAMGMAAESASVAAEPVAPPAPPAPPPPPPAPPAPRPPSAALPAASPAVARPAAPFDPSRPSSAAPPAALFATLPPTSTRVSRPPSAAMPAAPSAPSPASRPPSTAVPAAPLSASRPPSTAMPAADVPERSNGGRRRSSALAMSGQGEPRDWGPIPPIKDLLPAAPSVASTPAPVPVTALAPVPARAGPPMPVLIAVGLAALIILVLLLT